MSQGGIVGTQPTAAQGFSVAAIRARSTMVSKASQEGLNRRVSFDSNISEGPPIELEKSPSNGLNGKASDASVGSNKAVSFKPVHEVAKESPEDETAISDVANNNKEQNLTESVVAENEDENIVAKNDEKQNLTSALTAENGVIEGGFRPANISEGLNINVVSNSNGNEAQSLIIQESNDIEGGFRPAAEPEDITKAKEHVIDERNNLTQAVAVNNGGIEGKDLKIAKDEEAPKVTLKTDDAKGTEKRDN